MLDVELSEKRGMYWSGRKLSESFFGSVQKLFRIVSKVF